MADFQQIAAAGATIDDLEQAILSRASLDALEPSVIAHGKSLLRMLCQFMTFSMRIIRP
jgi:hypothetical protein